MFEASREKAICRSTPGRHKIHVVTLGAIQLVLSAYSVGRLKKYAIFLYWVNFGSQILNSHHYMHEFLLVIYTRFLNIDLILNLRAL